MPSEARRSLIRIAANYTRLFVNVAIGLLMVRLLLASVGNDGWAIIALLGAAVGIAAMAIEVIERSMVRELGAAFHRDDGQSFRATYNTAILLTAMLGVATLGIMAVVWAIIPLFEIPPELVTAARVMVVAKAIETFVTILAAPTITMFRVTERMVAANTGLILDRLGPFLAAGYIALTFEQIDASRGVILFATISAVLVVAGKLSQCAWMITLDRQLLPHPRRAQRSLIRGLLRVGGWNGAAAIAMALHIRLDNIIMNLFFGLFGNVIFGLTTQLSSYVRMITTGMTTGVDAVAARIESTGEEGRMRALLFHSTRLHGLITIPAAIGMFILAEPILIAWVGDRLQDPGETLAPTVMLIRLLTLGMACRAIGDGWIALLYGSGHIKRYAPIVLIGGLVNPAIAIALIMLLPDSIAYVGPTISYSAIFLVIHMGVIPWQMGRVVGQSYLQIVAPLGRVTMIAALCTPLLLVLPEFPALPRLVHLLMLIATYAAAYGLLTYAFVLNPAERKRITGFARRSLARRLRRSSGSPEGR